MLPSTDDSHSQRRANGAWRLKPSTIIVLLALSLLSTLHMTTSQLSHDTLDHSDTQGGEDHAVENQPVDEEEDAPRRRLQERKTLSPAARATVLMAHEMAVAHAKEKGQSVYEERADPFQTLREMALKNKADRKLKSPETQQELEDDDMDLPVLRQSKDWKTLDPLTTTSQAELENIPKLDLSKPQVEYLGVMVDAGRHFFPMEWWKRLLVHLEKLNYNMIHLRLTDDEEFIVQLKSHPELVSPVEHRGGARQYTPSELKELVALAKDHGITMIPEINLPLRAASWAGIPGLIVPCPNFICDTGHYVPLNLEHPQLSTILENVIQEILEIFDTPPLLHLGGSLSLHDADGCLEEAGMGGTAQYWEKFEGILRSVLQKVSYPEDQVIRIQSIEITQAATKEGDKDDEEETWDRVGGIEHYWMSLPASDKDGSIDQKGPRVLPGSIVSTDLDLAVDDDDNALTLYTKTREIVQLPEKPKAIVVGTSYLSTDLWLSRNVVARLIAIAMGASATAKDVKASPRTEFEADYTTNCHKLLGKNKPLCHLKGQKGHTLASFMSYISDIAKASGDQRHSLCKRLAVGGNERVFQPSKPDRNFATTIGNFMFWKNFHRIPKPYTPNFNREGAKKKELVKSVRRLKHRVEKTGVIFDLANSLVSAAEVQTLLLEYVAPLGFDMLQLRLSDDFAFAVRLENNTKLAQSHWNDAVQTPIPKLTDFQQVVDAASEWNIEVFPEVSFSTNAGGMVNGGFLVQCPQRFCSKGTAIPNDIEDPNLLPLVYSVLYELRRTFGGSSPYLHLGADERVENLKCFEENGLEDDHDPAFGVFEKKLRKLLLMLGILPKNVIRYDNIEQLTYEGRVGGITHYHIPDEPGSMPDVREGEEPFWMTADLLTANIYSIYKDARLMVCHKPLAVLGEIRTLDRKVWEEQHMGIRLSALMLGLSDAKDGHKALTHEEFVKEVLQICRAVKFPDYKMDQKCGIAEKLLNSEKKDIKGDDDAIDDQPTLFPVATKKFREPLCAKFTRPRKTMVMREQYVPVTEKGR